MRIYPHKQINPATYTTETMFLYLKLGMKHVFLVDTFADQVGSENNSMGILNKTSQKHGEIDQ